MALTILVITIKTTFWKLLQRLLLILNTISGNVIYHYLIILF